jgi:5-methylcytosine-specific restriction endonuclease McrA
MKNYKNNNHCKCGKLITDHSKYCIQCFGILKRKPEVKKFCSICKKEIKDFYAKLCKSCARKGNKFAYINGKGYEPYSSEFTEQLKNQIRRRDNYECQNCGMTEEEHSIVYGRVLDVHHIDYDKQNCKEYNLISLCCGCNLRANYNRDYWQQVYTIKILNKVEVKDEGGKNA